MTVEVFDCTQGSPEWHEVRRGVVTASELHCVLAKGKDKKPDGSTSKTRRAYMLKLVGEILSGEVAEGYSNGHMERGKAMEAELRARYALQNLDVDPMPVGFIRNTLKGGLVIGCSPDSLIGTNGGLEIKSALPHIQVERLLADELPPEHKPQVQGSMWVAEREWWDFVSGWPRLPLLVKRIYRDDSYIVLIERETRAFVEEMNEVEKRIRAMEAGPTTMADLRESVTILGAAE